MSCLGVRPCLSGSTCQLGGAEPEREHHWGPWGHCCLSSVYLNILSSRMQWGGKSEQLVGLEAHIKADCRPFCSQTGGLGGGYRAQEGRIGQGIRQPSHPGSRDQEVRPIWILCKPDGGYTCDLLPLGFIIQGQWCFPPILLLCWPAIGHPIWRHYRGIFTRHYPKLCRIGKKRSGISVASIAPIVYRDLLLLRLKDQMRVSLTFHWSLDQNIWKSLKKVRLVLRCYVNRVFTIWELC